MWAGVPAGGCPFLNVMLVIILHSYGAIETRDTEALGGARLRYIE